MIFPQFFLNMIIQEESASEQRVSRVALRGDQLAQGQFVRCEFLPIRGRHVHFFHLKVHIYFYCIFFMT